MGVKRVINGVHVVPMGMANAFLIEGDDGLTLIDAGFPGKEAAVFGAIRGLGRSPDQLKHLIFTHGHPDHIGSAAAIVRETGARTYMHPLDIPTAYRLQAVGSTDQNIWRQGLPRAPTQSPFGARMLAGRPRCRKRSTAKKWAN